MTLSTRRQRDPEATAKQNAYKKRRVNEGTAYCDVCGWTFAGKKTTLCEVHHVVPVSCDGSYEAANMVLLCPNHHSMADQVGTKSKHGDIGYCYLSRYTSRAVATSGAKRWYGPETPEDLVATLRGLREYEHSLT